MKALIIEDEELIAQELKAKIREVASNVDVVEVIPSLKVARKWFMNNKEPDLLFMDVQLSDGVSFKLFDEFKLNCPVIFTTAYDEYAIKAFKVNGVDYLLKPVENEELRKAIGKCQTIVESQSRYPTVVMDFLQDLKEKHGANETKFKEKFIVNTRHQWLPVSTSDIAAFEKDSLFYIHTFGGDRFILDFESMDEIEELIDPRKFYRANRQWIINMETIKSVKPMENLKLVVTLKQPLNKEVDISREKAPSFKKWVDR